MLNWLFSATIDPYGYGSRYQGNYWNNPQPINTPQKTYTEERLHSLELACAALWELLKQKNGYTDDELKGLIQSIAHQPSNPHGVGDPKLPECPRCHHKLLTQNHTKCLWCGADIPADPFPSV